MIRNSGEEPKVIEYLKNPLDRDTLVGLINAMGTGVRALLRIKGMPYEELGLANSELTDDQHHRCDDGASDSDQPSNRRYTTGGAAVPPFRRSPQSVAAKADR